MERLEPIHSPVLYPVHSSRPLGLHWPGKGKPLVCLHGFGGCGQDFEALAAQKNRQRPIIALDLPGHGVQRDQVKGIDSFEDTMNSLADAIDRPFDLMGYSMGGRLALWAALRMDLPVEGLTLVGSSAGARSTTERVERASFEDQLMERLQSESIGDFMAWWQNLPIIQTQSRLDQGFLDSMLSRRRSQDSKGLMLAIAAFGTGRFPSLWSELESLSVPVSLFVGAEDQKYQDIAIEMAARIPKSRICLIQGAAHAPHLENTSGFASLIF